MKDSNDEIVTDQIWYKSKDGTKVPAFLIRKKSVLPTIDSVPEKPIPTLIYGYGGFGVPVQTSFGVNKFIFVNNFNGMVVAPNIRGGNEFGE